MEEKLNIKTNIIINTVASTGSEMAKSAALLEAITISENFSNLTQYQKEKLTQALYHMNVASTLLHGFFFVYGEEKEVNDDK